MFTNTTSTTGKRPRRTSVRLQTRSPMKCYRIILVQDGKESIFGEYPYTAPARRRAIRDYRTLRRGLGAWSGLAILDCVTGEYINP